jgi:hypothetical protein
MTDAVSSSLVIHRDDAIREKILSVEENLRHVISEKILDEQVCPLEHLFAPGAYARTIFVPKDTLVVTKILKVAHFAMLLQGKVTVATEEGPVLLTAPKIFVTKAGTKRVVYTHEDTMWTTIHVTSKTDLAEIEDDVVAKSYEEFDLLQDAYIKQLLPVMQGEGSL